MILIMYTEEYMHWRFLQSFKFYLSSKFKLYLFASKNFKTDFLGTEIFKKLYVQIAPA